MAPAAIFAVRHGERCDRKDADFCRRTMRPHDPPLTDDGIAMAVTLGAYLVEQFDVCVSSTIVLSSPLIRCVQTAAGIVRGMSESGNRQQAGVQRPHAKPDETMAPPIFIEPALLEGCYWIMYDLKRNPAVASPGHLVSPDPVYYDTAYIHDNVCSQVQIHKPFDLHCNPQLYVSDSELKEDDSIARCVRGAHALLSDPTFDDKTVILVGHGLSVAVWANAIAEQPVCADPTRTAPPYTGFVALQPVAHEGGAISWKSAFGGFSTPHLPCTPPER